MVSLGDPWELNLPIANSWGPSRKSIKFRYRFWYVKNIEKTSSNTRNANSLESKENGLSIRLNQAGIFPIIIASNLLPFLSYLTQSLQQNSSFGFLNNVIYYLLIVED